MRYLSVCSGIEAATVAWHPLGWQAAAFSEIEAFPRAVLAHHYPDTPCHGDFTTIGADDYGPVDLLVGGTPCQSFSVAGLRGGLADDRGNLALEFLKLADRKRPQWIVWENVPGVLSSSGGRDFGSFLGGLGQLGYGFAYRVLDAQFFGVPQRRRRVFVVGHLGDWRRAAAVLFERHSLSGNTPPRREKGPSVAALIANGVGTCGADDNQGQAGHLIPQGYGGETAPTAVAFMENQRGELRVSGQTDALSTGGGKPGQGYPAVCFTAKDHGADASDISPTLRSGSHSGSHANGGVMPAVAFGWQNSPSQGLSDSEHTVPTLDKSKTPAVAFDLRGREGGAQFEGPHDTANVRAASGGSSRSYVAASAVRRLTPEECEKLQGFQPGYTAVPYRGKPAADGPRYKALGNSMAVPVMRWIGERIQMVEALAEQREAA